ncbi:MAG: hypothetical protein QG607_601 [Patescibacteria group bacterium]|nr:hypothetical protein [Patescibacteria group bacterium]
MKVNYNKALKEGYFTSKGMPLEQAFSPLEFESGSCRRKFGKQHCVTNNVLRILEFRFSAGWRPATPREALAWIRQNFHDEWDVITVLVPSKELEYIQVRRLGDDIKIETVYSHKLEINGTMILWCKIK